MRFYEMVMTALLLSAVAWRLLSKGRRTFDFVLRFACLGALGLHLAVEGAHWQMVPVYVALLLLWPLQGRGRRAALISALAMLMLIAGSCVAAAILPIFKLPNPTGAYAIGTRMLYLVDPSRTNDPAPGTKGRDIAVQLWYPAGPSSNRFAPYRQLEESTLRVSYMSVVPTHSRQDAPLLAGKTPWHVLLFNPAWDNRRGQSTALVEELASQGYVVAAIEHPGRTGPIALPDGRVIPVLSEPAVDDLGNSTVERVEAAIGREVDKEAVDNSFVLDQLALQNADSRSPLYQRLDTDHAGVLGHSLGGAVAASACALDPRLISALSMSGSFFGKVRITGLTKPYLNISEEVTLASPGSLAQMGRAQQVDAESDLLDARAFDRLIVQNGGYVAVIRGINHSSFTDQAFYSPLRKLSGVGPTPRDRVQWILRQYAVQFFGKTLEGKPSPLLDDPQAMSTPFPEVTQRYFPGEQFRQGDLQR